MSYSGILTRYNAGTGIILALLLCGAMMVVPASAATKYLGGAPAFSATISGPNEFTPGDEATISILVKNSGINQVKQVDRGTIEPEDLPNTAKTVTLGLGSDTDTIIIKTDSQMVGDIQGNGNSVPVTFRAKISANATAGEYQLPLSIQYRYPKVADQEVADVFAFTYQDAREVVPVTTRVKPQVRLEVIAAEPEDLVAGSEGYLHLKIRNTGREDGEMAVVRLMRNGKSPLIPVDTALFTGSLPSGGVAECRFRISVTRDAAAQTYPLDIVIKYLNREGTFESSSVNTVGVDVMDPPVFTTIREVREVPQGDERTFDVLYRNNGNLTVYDAQARITSQDSVAFKDNEAFLGDLKPNETRSARFRIRAESDAPRGTYSFDSRIRYHNALGTTQESDTIPVQVTVVSSTKGPIIIPGGVFGLAAGVVSGIVISIALLAYHPQETNGERR